MEDLLIKFVVQKRWVTWEGNPMKAQLKLEAIYKQQ
jgi:hypothetical protein